jgi:hypothetical protein
MVVGLPKHPLWIPRKFPADVREKPLKRLQIEVGCADCKGGSAKGGGRRARLNGRWSMVESQEPGGMAAGMTDPSSPAEAGFAGQGAEASPPYLKKQFVHAKKQEAYLD